MKRSASGGAAAKSGLTVKGGKVGGPDDPMLDARTRLLKKLEAEGKTLDDVTGEGKGGTGEAKSDSVKVQ